MTGVKTINFHEVTQIWKRPASWTYPVITGKLTACIWKLNIQLTSWYKAPFNSWWLCSCSENTLLRTQSFNTIPTKSCHQTSHQPLQTSSHSQNNFSKYNINIILPSTPYSKWPPFTRLSKLKFCMYFCYPHAYYMSGPSQHTI
jgi:hypothetical protein